MSNPDDDDVGLPDAEIQDVVDAVDSVVNAVNRLTEAQGSITFLLILLLITQVPAFIQGLERMFPRLFDGRRRTRRASVTSPRRRQRVDVGREFLHRGSDLEVAVDQVAFERVFGAMPRQEHRGPAIVARAPQVPQRRPPEVVEQQLPGARLAARRDPDLPEVDDAGRIAAGEPWARVAVVHTPEDQALELAGLLRVRHPARMRPLEDGLEGLVQRELDRLAALLHRAGDGE